MVYLKKIDGRDERFVPEKIVASVMKCGVPFDEAERISQVIEERAGWGITTREIRSDVLRMLRELNPVYEQRWLKYERKLKSEMKREILV